MPGSDRQMMRQFKAQDWYKKVMDALADCDITDYQFVSKSRGGHHKLICRLNGQVFKTPVPCSERRKGNHHYLASRIKRFARQVRDTSSTGETP